MGRLIAVWGAPHTGKTTVACRLGAALSNGKNGGSVCVICPDNRIPMLPVLFPARKQEELPSVGNALSEPDLQQTHLLRAMVTGKNRDLVYMGYAAGETVYSYPVCTPQSAASFFAVLSGCVEYIVVDCDSMLNEPLSRHAVWHADTVLRLVGPDLSSLSWNLSRLTEYRDPSCGMGKQWVGVSVTENGCLPVRETADRLPNALFSLPYAPGIRQLLSDGDLPYGKMSGSKADRAYTAKIEKLADRIRLNG